MKYVGQTQRSLKDRMNEHCNDVKKGVEKGKDTDSFAAHFRMHLEEVVKVKAHQVRALFTTKILWQGNPISCVKSFKKMNCTLCMKERTEIMKRSFENDKKAINNCSELYGACKHNPAFHRFTKGTVKKGKSTDDGLGPERVKKKKMGTKKKERTEPVGPAPPFPSPPLILLPTEFCIEINSKLCQQYVGGTPCRRSPRLAELASVET
jgi:hypothetical protein